MKKSVKRKAQLKKIIQRSTSATQVKYDYLLGVNRSRNGNWQSRCGCTLFDCSTNNNGQNYLTIRNTTNKEIRVFINDFGEEQAFNRQWDSFIARTDYRLFDSGIIPPNSTRGSYFYNNTGGKRGGNRRNVFPGTGTIGLQVLDPSTHRMTFWGLWFSAPGVGKEWLLCGYGYTFRVEEEVTLIQTDNLQVKRPKRLKNTK